MLDADAVINNSSQSVGGSGPRKTHMIYAPVYGDSVDNTVEENSSVFSIIRMRCLPPAKGMQAVKLCTDKILQF